LLLIKITFSHSLDGTVFIYLVLTKINHMDNPNKKKADAKRVSQQPHEQAYQKRKKAAAKKGVASRQKAK
jgi:hypothetical protein